MQSQTVASEYITTSWAVVKGFFSREQKLLEHITYVEKSLHQAGWQNQQDRIAYQTLLSQYEQLYEGYQKILGSYESLLETIGERSSNTPPKSACDDLAVIFEQPNHPDYEKNYENVEYYDDDGDVDEDVKYEVGSV